MPTALARLGLLWKRLTKRQRLIVGLVALGLLLLFGVIVYALTRSPATAITVTAGGGAVYREAVQRAEQAAAAHRKALDAQAAAQRAERTATEALGAVGETRQQASNMSDDSVRSTANKVL